MTQETETASLPKLRLPKRYEILEREAKERGIDTEVIAVKVETASRQVDAWLRHIDSTGCGQIEIILGQSGSGKTTFVKTLRKFFSNIKVEIFPKSEPLTSLIPLIENQHLSGDQSNRVYLIDGRDNPKKAEVENCKEFLDELRDCFRSEYGQVLVLWPVTDEASARILAESAWEVGADSITDVNTKGLYLFRGLDRKMFHGVADSTARNLTGDSLEGFGITREHSVEALQRSATISEYYTHLENLASKIRGETWSALKNRVAPKI